MTDLKYAKKYCENYTEIENYDKALNDTTQLYDCHHRLENLGFSRQQLIEMGMYYNVEPWELIFITHSEHMILHHKGKKHSDSTKQKISNSIRSMEHFKEWVQRATDARTKHYIRCIETGEVHSSIEWKKLGYDKVGSVASGKRKSCGGLHFEYVK